MLDDTRKPGLGALLTQATAAWQNCLNQALARDGQDVAAGAAGELLLRIPAAGIAQAALTRQTGLSKQAVQQVLDRLEAQGAIRRDADPADRRAKRIIRSEKGLHAGAARRSLEDTLEAELRERLGKKLYRRLRKGLRHVGQFEGPPADGLLPAAESLPKT